MIALNVKQMMKLNDMEEQLQSLVRPTSGISDANHRSETFESSAHPEWWFKESSTGDVDTSYQDVVSMMNKYFDRISQKDYSDANKDKTSTQEDSVASKGQGTSNREKILKEWAERVMEQVDTPLEMTDDSLQRLVRQLRRQMQRLRQPSGRN
jgi:hypothetical protein